MHRSASLWGARRALLAWCSLALFAGVVAVAGLGVTSPRAAHAQTARVVVGRVVDAETSEPLGGASVQLAGTSHGAVTDARGDFRITLAPNEPGTRVRVRVTVIGYQTLESELDTEAAGEATSGAAGTGTSATAPPLLRLTPIAIPIAGAEVSSHLARENRSPTAFSVLDRREIEREHWGQDMPMLLAETPGAYAYSDAGNGIGYSYLKIRGFSQRRIAVMINGIPLNDPQSREVYWIDHPDLAASAQTIQVQRGVGSSAYGTTAIGGSVNVETIPYEQSPRMSFEAGGGSFGTQRYSAQVASGLIDERYAVQARLSRILTNGYREQSWSDLWSYFLGITRVDRSMVTRLNFYGGPERTHLAYLGVPRENLDGAVTGDREEDRRVNPLTWTGERDNFFEPHYELLHDWKLSQTTSLSNALFYFPGKGYYDEYRTDQFLADYGLSGGPPTADLTRRRWAKNIHVGWVPRVRHESGRYALEGGLDLRFHEGRRFGEVLWTSASSPGQQPNHVYYDYIGRVTNTNAFLRQSWAASERFRLTGDLAFHRQRYEMGHDVYTGRSFDETYTFLMPRAGVNVALREAPETAIEHLEGYASYSYAEAEPIFRELYDAENANSIPGFANEDANGRLTDPLIDPEMVNDWAAGVRGRGPWGTASLGGFWMQFEDEIVFNGTLDDNGNPITGNAARSHHAGIEGDVRARVGKVLELAGAFHWAVNEFDDYHEFTGDTTATNDYSGNAIAGFPDRAFHANAILRHGGGRLELGVDYAGRQYLDNTESEVASIAPWTVANATLGWRLAAFEGVREVDLSLRVQNVFDRHYETSGYIDYPAPLFAPTPTWIPAATRGVFFTVKTTL